MKLTIKSTEEKVDIDGIPYILLEGSEDVHQQYQLEMKRGSKVLDAKSVILGEGVITCDVLLVHLCLYRADARGELPRDNKERPDRSKRVPLEELKSWPRRNALKPLIDKAKDICGIASTREDLIKERDRLNEQIKAYDAVANEDEEKN